MKLAIKSKKGQEEGGGFSTAIGLVILVVAVIIIVPLIQRQTAFASDLSEATACYTSIVGIPGASGETGAKCPIRDYVVYNNRVTETKDGKTSDSDIVKYFSADENKVYELFAKLIGSCLQKGGGVNSNAFSRSSLGSTVCLECSNIKFDNNVAKVSFNGLREYLENNKMPGKDKKYVDVFTKDEAHKEDWINYGQQKDRELIPGKYGYPIEKNNIYTIFFIGIKEGRVPAIALNLRLIGREDTYFVYAATQENFNKICDRKVN